MPGYDGQDVALLDTVGEEQGHPVVDHDVENGEFGLLRHRDVNPGSG